MANDKEWLLKYITGKRLARLVWKVWRTIPARDRTALRGVLEVEETNALPEDWWGGCSCYDDSDGQNKFVYKVGLSPDLNSLEVSEARVCYIIAHEMAHAILRHPRMLRVINDVKEYQADEDTIKLLFEDQADLQVFDWGFVDGFKEMRAMKRDAVPRWYVESAMTYDDLLNELRQDMLAE